MRASLRSAIFVCVVACVLMLPGIANRDFSTRGEPREAINMQSMLSSGRVVLAEGYGGAVPSKPPLMHWLGTLASLPYGEVTATSARVPSALASLCALLFFTVFVAQRYGVERGILCGLMLLTSIEWFRTSVTARVDMLLSALLFAGLVRMWVWTTKECRGVPWDTIGLLALALLTKGPVSIALPAAIFGATLLLRRVSLRGVLLRSMILFFPAVAIGALWYIAAFVERPEAFMDKVWYENVARFLSSQEDEPHRGSALGLWLTMLVGLLPWSAYLAPWVSKLRPNFNYTLRALGEKWRSLDPFSRFSVLTIAVFLIFFAIPGSKRSVYLLPAYPFAVFLLSGAVLASDRFSRWAVRAVGIIGIFCVGVIALAPTLVDVVPHAIRSARGQIEAAFYLKVAANFIQNISFAELLVVLVVIGVCGCAAWRGEVPLVRRVTGFQRGWSSLVVVWSLLLFCGNAMVFPYAANPLSSRPFASELKGRIPSEVPLYSFGTEFYGLSFYMQRRIDRLEDTEIPAGSEIFVLLNEDDRERLAKRCESVIVLERSANPVTKPADHVLLARAMLSPAMSSKAQAASEPRVD